MQCFPQCCTREWEWRITKFSLSVRLCQIISLGFHFSGNYLSDGRGGRIERGGASPGVRDVEIVLCSMRIVIHYCCEPIANIEGGVRVNQLITLRSHNIIIQVRSISLVLCYNLVGVHGWGRE